MIRGRPMVREILMLGCVLAALLAIAGGAVLLVLAGRPDRTASESGSGLEARLRPVLREALLGQEKMLEDPRRQRVVEEVTRRLREAAPGLPEVEVVILDSPVVNAFALPGGLIAVHKGLLERLQCPEELAAVMAHELGHVAHRDAFNGLARAVGVAVLLAVLTGGSETVLSEVLERALALQYSRRAEERADRYAMDLLVRARLDPGWLAEALERLREEGAPPALLRYLDTHPEIGGRIARARERSARSDGAEEPLGLEWP